MIQSHSHWPNHSIGQRHPNWPQVLQRSKTIPMDQSHHNAPTPPCCPQSVDLCTEPSSPLSPAEVFGEERWGDAASLARSHGLNVSLYSAGGGAGGLERRPPSAPSDHVEQPRGAVAFTAAYLLKNNKLSVVVHAVEGLPPRGAAGEWEAVVRLSVLPGDKQAQTSKPLPRGEGEGQGEGQAFLFRVKAPAAGKALRLSVFDARLRGKHDALGHALLRLDDVAAAAAAACAAPRRRTLPLAPLSQLEPCFGSLQVYLQLSQERLIVDTIQARNLSAKHITKGAQSGEKFSTYIKITLYCAGQKVKSKKSPVVTGDRNPRYEYSCDFKVLAECMDACYLVQSVVLKGNIRKDVTLGRYVFGPYFFSESRDLTPWGRLVLNHEEVHHWFQLYL